MKIDMEGIKDAVYELEGLLELADLREDKLPALMPLMKKKLEIINALFSDSDSDEEAEEESLEDDGGLEDDSSLDEEDPSQYNIPDDDESEDEMTIISTSPINTSLSEIEEEDAPVFVASEEEKIETPIKTSKIEKPSVDPNAPKPAFCINDRFRFRRELFNNSDSEFNAAMDLVATMDDYEEAEDYFLGDLGWDMEKPEVMDFMAIIRNYFEK